MEPSLRDTLDERGARYGNFHDRARISQALQRVIMSTPNYIHLAADQKEALGHIATKVSRILNGDSEYVENWRDISGYATLVMDRLKETDGATDNASVQKRRIGGEWRDDNQRGTENKTSS